MGNSVIGRGMRRDLAMRARGLFVPYILADGIHEHATERGPANWSLQSWNLNFVFAQGVLLSPGDQSLSCLLDIWSAGYKKELSISWEPDRPWQPLRVASFDPLGAWIPLLDLIPAKATST